VPDILPMIDEPLPPTPNCALAVIKQPINNINIEKRFISGDFGNWRRKYLKCYNQSVIFIDCNKKIL